MPCNDSSSSIYIRLDSDEKFISFEFAKITCGSPIDGKTGLSEYFKGKPLQEILTLPFGKVVHDLNLHDEESQFILYMEWDALRSSIAQYLGTDDESIDKDRCRITSIDHNENSIEIAEVILPPKQLPKILPCHLKNQN